MFYNQNEKNFNFLNYITQFGDYYNLSHTALQNLKI